MEVWKDIKDYKGYYMISSYGNVRSCDRTVIYSNGNAVNYKGKDRKPSVSDYRLIALSKDGTVKMVKISRLVANHFIPKIEGKNIVNHIDGNKHNDKASNLEWCTISENNLHAFKNNLSKKVNKVSGVWLRKDRKKWESYIYRDNKNIRVGSFESEEEAVKERELYLIEYNKKNEKRRV